MSRCQSRIICLLLFAFLLITHHSSLITVFGQSATATLSGTVADERDAIVPGASVTVTNVSTNLRRQAITGGDGTFTVPLLPPATYTVRVERENFAPVEIPGVVLNVNDNVALSIQLKVGQIGGDVVTVNADANTIQQTPEVATVVDRQFVENLPLNGRSFQTLIELIPGTVLTTPTATGLEKGGFSTNGQRANANYFTVDGVSANIGSTSGNAPGQSDAGSVPALTAFGGTNNLVSVDALQEFKVLTSTYAPEFGRSPGAQVSIVTRSGTNEIRGTLFEYFRNDALDANDWFANSRRLSKPPLRQNDFGGVVGGPLYLPRFGEGGPAFYSGKNQTFFFFSYEGLRLHQPQTSITQVPSLAARQSATAQIKPFLNAFPIPNGRDLGNGLAEFSASYSDQSTLNATSIRMDHTVSSGLSIFGRYNYAPSETAQRLVGGLSTLSTRPNKTQTLTVGITWAITPNLSHDFRANWSKARSALTSSLDDFGGAVPLPDTLIFPTFAARQDALFTFFILPGISLTAGKNNDHFQRQVNLVDNLSIVAGTHQMKFGVDFRRLSPILGQLSYAQTPIFSSVAQALTGRTLFVNIQATPGESFPAFNNFSAYAQDVWKVKRRLTLTYGLRWEVNPPPSEKNGYHPAVVTGLDNPATLLALAPFGTPLWKTTYDNFAPRVGVAYQLSQRQGRETVVRGGFGIFYDLGNGQAARPFSIAFPFVSSKNLFGVPFPLDTALAQPGPFSLNPPFGTIYAFDPNLELPRTYQWNIAVEQSLGSNQTVSASYVAAVGRRLLRLEGLRNPNPNFTTVNVTRNSATSDYHAMQLQFARRLSRGLQVLASYTWSKSLDIASNDSGTNPPAGRINLNQERGPSDFDVRHAFNAAVTYDLPTPAVGTPGSAILRNWSVDTIIRARSATPVNVVAGTDPFGLGLAGQFSVVRPDLISGVPLYVDDSMVAGGRRINRAAFAIPPPGRQGTLGRNSLRGFSLSQVDFALRRQFNLSERFNVQFRAEFFNVFNRPNFANPVNNLDSALFGQSIQLLGRSLQGLSPLFQIGGPRSTQLSLRLGF